MGSGAALLALSDAAFAAAASLVSPLLVLQGSADTVVPPALAFDFYTAASSRDKAFIAYPDAKHGLMCEPLATRMKMCGDITGWLDGMLARTR